MQLQIEHGFDPIFETLGLLYNSAQSENRDEVIRQLIELGVDGEKFYKKYYKLIERYTRIFKKHMKRSEHMDFFFQDKGDDFYLLMAVLLCENRQWLDSLEGVTDREIRELAGSYLQDEDGSAVALEAVPRPKLADEKDLIAFLSKLDAAPELKWRLLEFMEQPVYWMEILTGVVQENLSACEKALEAMEKPLEPLLKAYEKYEDRQFQELAELCAPGSSVYPTFIAGVSQHVYYTRCYQGIFMEFLIKKGGSTDEKRERTITRMKALGDKSKLDILCELKHSSKYNLELAETMKLSPSTMSHHMGVLFACGFVGVEKSDGRIYYVLKKDAVRECIEDLSKLLL